ASVPLAEVARGGVVAAVLDVLAHFGLQRRSADQNLVSRRRDDLRINVVVRPGHYQPVRALPRDAHARPATAASPSVLLVHLSSSDSPLCLLGFLERHLLAYIAHAFTLVGLGRAVSANLRCDLAAQMLCAAFTHEFRLLRRIDLDALRHAVTDRMREAQRQIELVARRLSAVA